MKKRLLSYITIVFSAFLLTSRVNAISCEYGDVKRDDDAGNTFTTKVTVNYDNGNYFFVRDSSPDITSGKKYGDYSVGGAIVYCVPEDTNNAKEYSCETSAYSINTNFSWKLDIPTEIGNEYFAQGKCPEIIYLHRYYKSSWGTKTEDVFLYTFSEEVSTHDDDSFWESLTTFDTIFDPILYEEKNYYDQTGYTPEEAGQDHCLFWEAYYGPLERSVQGSNTSCDANQEFSKAYQDLSDRCSRYLSNFGYTSSEEPTSTSNGSLSASKCAKRCSGLRDTVAIMCKKTAPAGCDSIGGHLLNWIYRMIKFVRYAVPALLIILSILDFIKAIASESDDEIKKVSSRFTKRLIAAALIFIAPFILDFILKMFSIPGLNDPFCANK